MTTPSPYDIARSVGNNLSSTITNASDRSVIDEIMENASKTENPADMQKVIADVIKRVSPDRRQAVLGAVTEKAKQMQVAQEKQKSQSNMNKLADMIDEMPGKNNKVLAAIYRADMKPEERRVAIQGLDLMDPAKGLQQLRLERDSITTLYGTMIKEIDNELKTLSRFSSNYDELIKQKRALQEERAERLGLNKKMQDAKKTPWDPDNPDHINRRKELEKNFNGDRQKVNEALAEEFSVGNA